MRWAAALYLDGVQVTEPIPCDDFDAACIASPLVASWLGGPVSAANAVAAARADAVVVDEPTLFDEVA